MKLSFLKKVGSALSQGLAFAESIGPIIIPALGSKAGAVVSTVINDFTAIAQVIAQIEAIFQGDGRGLEKVKAAVPIVASIVRTSEIVAGRAVADETLFVTGVQNLITSVVQILNSLSNKFDTTGDPLPAPPAARPAPSTPPVPSPQA